MIRRYDRHAPGHGQEVRHRPVIFEAEAGYSHGELSGVAGPILLFAAL
jgi:hypothetical protein